MAFVVCFTFFFDFQGVFGGGKFEDLEDLIKVVTATIFIASVSHARANFAQYDEYAFIPVYPAKLYGEVPTDKVSVQYLLNILVRGSQYNITVPNNAIWTISGGGISPWTSPFPFLTLVLNT